MRPWRTAAASIALFAALPKRGGLDASRRLAGTGSMATTVTGTAPARAGRRSTRTCLADWQVFVSRHRVEQRWIWDEKAATLGFSVLPAYYQTNWFRGLVARVSLALVWLAYEWRVRQLRRAYEATLDARVAERTRIARELHDTLLKSFQALALRFQAALNVLPDRPAEAEARLTAALSSR
jgi:signal transduction histidine kinase